MAHFEKRTLKNGKTSWSIMFRYTDWTGNHKQTKKSGFARKADAIAYQQDFLQRVAGSPEMTFENLWAIFKKDYKRRTKASSYITVTANVEKRVLPFFAKTPISQITPDMIRNWEHEMQDSGDLTIKFINYLHGRLSSVLRFAQKFYGLNNNPAVTAGYSLKETSSPNQIHFWTVQQFKKFDLAARGDEPCRTLFMLLFWSGLRLGEARALTIADIDFDAGTIHVSKTFHRYYQKDIVTSPKTPNSNRVVPVPPQLLEVLRDFIQHLPNRTKKTRLFDILVSDTAIRDHFYKISEKAGLPRIKIHDLRHSHASMLIQQNVAPLVIRDRLGHKSIQTTLDIYSHLYPTKGEEIAGILSKIW